jgi:hypothetical protein
MSPLARSTVATRAHLGRVAALAAVLVLAGCSSPSPAPTDSPKESQQKMLALLDEVQAEIGGTWKNEDSPSPRSCTISGTKEEGVTFTGNRTQKGPAMDDEQISDVLALWESKGFDAGKGKMGMFVTVLAVNRDDKNFYSQLLIAEYSTSISGQGACVPGDVLTELDRVNKELGS